MLLYMARRIAYCQKANTLATFSSIDINFCVVQYSKRRSSVSTSPRSSLGRNRFSTVAARPTEALDLDCIKNAVKLVVEEEASKITTDECIRKRLDDFERLVAEARLCIEDCADLEETKDFVEETNVAREAVREACAAFSEIIDDLKEKNTENSDRLKSRIERTHSLKLEGLKGELNVILDGLHH